MEELKTDDTGTKRNKHPYESAGFLSKAFFCWLFPLFYKGFKRDITEDDIFPPLKSHESSRLGDKFEKVWLEEVRKNKDPSMWKALWKIFWKELCWLGVFFIFIELFVKLAQPIALSQFLQYFDPSSEMTIYEAYLYGGVIVLSSLVNVLCNHMYVVLMFHLGMKIRVAVCSAIYRKALKLSKTALAETTIGQMVNLLSNDVGRFDFATIHIHHLWLAPIETVVIMYLLYYYVGATAMGGVVFLLMFIPFQMWMGKKASVYRLRTAIRTDERIRLMNEIISGIQVIKMYTWEKPFAKLVEISRRKEIKEIKKIAIIRAIMMSFILFLNRVAIYICILTYVLTGHVPSAQYVFVLSSFYGILRQSVTMFFPQGVTYFAETSISIKRIKHFLMYDELTSDIANQDVQHNHILIGDNDKSQNGAKLQILNSLNKPTGISLNNVSVKWIKSSSENTLSDITLIADSGELVALVGPVGSGKTTLLHVILKELLPLTGTVEVNGVLSYASQEPWLFGGSVRQNILFGQPFNKKKYDQVVRVCALERDFTLFRYGDRTLVGERGVSLSGGQRARINLARAVYKDADIYLLDDPLSAVDTHVGKQIFDECINGYLKEKCVILITHQLQYLRSTKKICLLSNGRIEASGTYKELQNYENEFTNLLSKHEKENNEEDDKEKEDVEQEAVIDDFNIQEAEKEGRGTGHIDSEVYFGYIFAAGHWCKIVTLFTTFVLSQILASSCDYFLSMWVNVGQANAKMANVSKSLFNETEDISTTLDIPEPTISSQDLVFWDKIYALINPENCITIYSSLLGMVVTLTLLRSFTFYRFSLKASIRLHNNMFNKIVYGTMRFFNTNPSGRILNRFSKDIGSIDEQLPLTLLDTIQIGMTVLAITLVIGTVNPWMLLPSVIILTIFYFIRVVFLATSRDIKRLEGITRSPIYSHLSASLQGLTTIRAFGAQEILKQEFDRHQNVYSGAYFMFLGANRTFGFWLDVHCVVYIAFVTLSFLFLQNNILGGDVGLAITQSLNLTGMFQWGMRQWSELENQMTCVERVKEYTDIQPESDNKTKTPPSGWPKFGNISFQNLCLRYIPDEPYILKNLTFNIKSGEKVGIVGRTGAGKSSLIAALFRLTHIDGRILIDDVDTKEIPLNSLRSQIAIIPQEPVLFTGTMRKNLDPFDEYSDEVLWSSLEEVELKSVVADLPEGLRGRVSEGGSNFSVGQRQLVCLARAIIRNNKVLLMDEATANVDPYTDGLIQSTIRTKFANCTVLTIAHRLHTIMDSDKVLVMDAGRAVEFDHPYKLLQDEEGIFYGLVQQTGKAMAENLTKVAEETYNGASC